MGDQYQLSRLNPPKRYPQTARTQDVQDRKPASTIFGTHKRYPKVLVPGRHYSGMLLLAGLTRVVVADVQRLNSIFCYAVDIINLKLQMLPTRDPYNKYR